MGSNIVRDLGVQGECRLCGCRGRGRGGEEGRGRGRWGQTTEHENSRIKVVL